MGIKQTVRKRTSNQSINNFKKRYKTEDNFVVDK